MPTLNSTLAKDAGYSILHNQRETALILSEKTLPAQKDAANFGAGNRFLTASAHRAFILKIRKTQAL